MPIDIPPQATVLLVDDSPAMLDYLTRLLHGSYKLKLAGDGARALQLAAAAPPDAILLDVEMPGMDGYQVCRALKANPATQAIPVLMLTALDETACEQTGLDAGAADYLTKPVQPAILERRLRLQLQLAHAQRLLRDRAAHLESEVAARTRDLADTQEATIVALASLAETRDNETGNHIRRTQLYVRRLAEHLAGQPRDAALLTPAYIDLLYKSAPLHDVGKVGIADAILLKPGKLTAEEYATMKQHARIGHDALARAEQLLGRPIPFLELAKQIALYHHEKWDGLGYPHGLAGEAIPLAARLMALADVYDALISRRVYKDGMDHTMAESIIIQGRGSHFDPAVVDAFLALRGEFHAIAARYADAEVVQ